MPWCGSLTPESDRLLGELVVDKNSWALGGALAAGLFLCLSALYCDNAVARRVGKPRAGDENAGSAPAADSE